MKKQNKQPKERSAQTRPLDQRELARVVGGAGSGATTANTTMQNDVNPQ